MSDSIFIINEGLEMRTSSTGRTRFAVRIVSEPLVIRTDHAFLAMKPAKAMAAFFRERVAGITAAASPNTIRARQTALKAFIQGKEWAMKRYSGGRMGSMPPLRTEQAFNDSGRFAKSIAATVDKNGTWRVNVAGNRLDESTAHSFERVWNRLVQLVPEFGKGISDTIVAEGLRWTAQNMIKKHNASSRKLAIGIAKELWRTVEIVGDVLAA